MKQNLCAEDKHQPRNLCTVNILKNEGEMKTFSDKWQLIHTIRSATGSSSGWRGITPGGNLDWQKQWRGLEMVNM